MKGAPVLHIFKVENIDQHVFAGIPSNIFIRKSGKCFTSIAFKPALTIDLYVGDAFSFDIAIGALREFTTTDGVLCSGVNIENVNPSCSVVGHQWPLVHYRSKECTVFTCETRSGISRCWPCKRAVIVQKAAQKRKLSETLTRKLKRARIQSKCRVSYLTPNTRKKRLRAGSQMRHYFSTRARELSEKLLAISDTSVNADQSAQMSAVVDVIQHDYADVLSSVINESTQSETEREAVRSIWKRDCEQRTARERADFEADQKKNSATHTGNRFSTITYRLALAVYARSPAAYRALASFDLLRLPSVYSVRNASRAYSSEAGVSHEYLATQQKRYADYKEEKLRKGEKLPVGEGVLIFDEVKVIDKLLWNSKTHKFVGLAMDERECMYVSDILHNTASPGVKGAEYVLQFLWRDLSAKFDVIEPYFLSEKSINHGFLTGCLYETMRVMHAYGFKVSCIVCDGASINLTVIKNTLGQSGPFKADISDLHVSIQNPFDSTIKCYWIICPSHQLKNMISALNSSRNGGTKKFVRNNIHFGWHDIVAMKKRDDVRVQNGQIRLVRGLLQA